MKSMQGVTVTGILFVALVVIFATVIGMNLIPPYIDNFGVKKALKALNAEPDTAIISKPKLRDKFIRKLDVNNIKNISPDALIIEKIDGQAWMILNYEVRVHLIGNIDAVLKFNEKVRLGEKSEQS